MALKRRWFAAPFALAALLAACGGGGGSGSTDNSSASGPPPAGSVGTATEFSGASASGRGELVSAELVSTLTRADSASYLETNPDEQPLVGGTATCDVQLYRLTYSTGAPDGSTIHDTAALHVPIDCAGPFPLLLLNHGTTLQQGFTASVPDVAQRLTPYFSGQGYVTVMPDYSGYFQSTLDYHPYAQAENGAVVTIDALRAARTFLASRQVALTDRLFIFGSSQGGGITMGTVRAMERDYPDEFAVTASVPTSGNYDLEASVVEQLSTDTVDDPPAVSKATMLLTSYQRTYGDIYAETTDTFQLPWAGDVTGLLPGDMNPFQLVDAGLLPPKLTGSGALLTDAWVSDFLANPDNPTRIRLRQNSLISWTPQSPMSLCGSADDPGVPFWNTLTAASQFASRGVTTPVEDVSTDPEYTGFIAGRLNGQTPEDAVGYHGVIVDTACQSYAKVHVFDPLR